jgi:hypothetical protein
MSRLSDAWRAMEPDQRLASIAAIGLLVTMFLPWYGLQSLNRKTGVISSHSINAFGDVSFVEAAVFLVAAAVVVMLIARVEGREFHLPGGDGTIVMLAGGWAALLIFYRVFSRPAGNGYPVGIEWGFFLAFVAAGALAYAGWRIRAGERPEPPARGPRSRERAPSRREPARPAGDRPPERGNRREEGEARASAPGEEGEPTGATEVVRSSAPAADSAPVPADRRRTSRRPRYPPAPPGSSQPEETEQLSFEDSPPRSQ